MEELTFRLQQVIQSKEELGDFEGPLDVILQLLSKNKMDIADLKISLVVDQYLAYMQEMQELNLEIASEFTLMASHLVYLKSRMLLTVGQGQEDDDMALLLRALEERKNREVYEKILLGVAFLEPLSYIGRELFAKPPSQLVKDPIYKHLHKPEELVTAMNELYTRQQRRAPPGQTEFMGIVGVEPYPVERKITILLDALAQTGRTGMMGLFRQQKSRSEVVALFLAVLELSKEARVSVEQVEGDLVVTLRASEAV